jgi:hypothetical protein
MRYLIFYDGLLLVLVNTQYEVYCPDVIKRWYSDKYDFPLDKLTCQYCVNSICASKEEVVEYETK